MMNDTSLEALLNATDISPFTAEHVLYETLLFLTLQRVCDHLRINDEAYKRWKSIFRHQPSHAAFAQRIVREYCHHSLDEDSSQLLGQWFLAFFRKGTVRHIYPTEVKANLLEQQKNLCAICNAPIVLASSTHLDHIVPWIYVGDELPNNLQCLCETCNKQKSSSPLYQLRALLKNGNTWNETSA